MASLWFAGLSRDQARKRRSYAESKRASRTLERDEGDQEFKKQPSQDELRKKRLAYHTATPAERRRISAEATAKAKSKSTTSLTAKSVTTSDQRHQRRKSKSSSKSGSGSSLRSSKRHSSRSGKSSRSSSEHERRKDEDYVYAPRPTVLDPIREEQQSESDDQAESSRHSVHRRSSKRFSSSTLFDEEVTPEDSISNVGLNPRPERRRHDAYSRPSLKRSSTTSSRLERVREEPDHRRSSTSKRSVKSEKSSSGSTNRRHSTSSVPQLPSVVECLTCGSDDVPAKKAAKLSCGHCMCHDCIRRIFELSVKDPQHMPPRCCTDDPIPIKYVDILFDDKFKTKWTRKYKEYNTRDRLYCATPRCGNWIKPVHIHSERGRTFATCGRCKTKVCGLCGHKMHKSTECPKDPEIAEILKRAKEEGWQRCYSCNAMVERKEGCNHMTCRCKAEFCIMCAKEWKTCDCPWFNYTNTGNPPGAFNPDLLNDWNIPEPIHVLYRQVFRAAADAIPPPPAPRAREPAGRANRAGPPREVTYQQEMDRRREQERTDADLARRLQFASIWDPEDGEPGRHRNGAEELLGLGNAARHFLNDDFVQNAANVVMNAFGDANMGRRGERSSGRRRRASSSDQNEGEPGLAPDFLGDESVLGVGSSRRSGR